jgi:hypothetical protein
MHSFTLPDTTVRRKSFFSVMVPATPYDVRNYRWGE